MPRKGTFFKYAGALITASVLATMGTVLNASPASARPIDCAMSTSIGAASNGMQAGATVYCTRAEHYHITVYIHRDDALTNPVVASAVANSNGAAGYVRATALEPCSELQTNKNYFAIYRMFDTTYTYPVEVKKIESLSLRGHC